MIEWPRRAHRPSWASPPNPFRDLFALGARNAPTWFRFLEWFGLTVGITLAARIMHSWELKLLAFASAWFLFSWAVFPLPERLFSAKLGGLRQRRDFVVITLAMAIGAATVLIAGANIVQAAMGTMFSFERAQLPEQSATANCKLVCKPVSPKSAR
ncbi:MAG: hypothetical protein ACREEB_13365 [Caulobacteraceae bacterium]